MTLPPMDLLGKARQLESRIARRLDRAAKDFVRSPAGGPLETARAIVERVEEEIQPGGRGTRVFPFTQIAISVAAAGDDLRARFAAVFDSPPTLRDRIAERLAAAGCTTAAPLVAVEYVAKPHKNWRRPDFDVRFTQTRPASEPAIESATPEPRLELQVARGTAERRSYTFASTDRIDIGRCREVRDARHRLVRANDVAFTEGDDGANQTVSRQHAHIVYDERSGEFRLRDDGSAQGPAVLRAGKTVHVPRGARGVRLQAGDEIVLGDARLRVRLL